MLVILLLAVAVCGIGFLAGCVFAAGTAYQNGYERGRRSVAPQRPGFTVVGR